MPEIRDRKRILKYFLESLPIWFDLRKKEILKDEIDIPQWQHNMIYLISKYGTIDSCEERAAFNTLHSLGLKYEAAEVAILD